MGVMKMRSLKELKRNRSAIGSWFLGSWVSFILVFIHVMNTMNNVILTTVQIVMITLFIENNILSSLAVLNINSEIKKIQGHI